MSDWQPIETAPRDGTVILVWDNDTVMTANWYEPPKPHESPRWEHNWNGEVLEDCFPITHWMPLPEPPQ